MAALLIEGVAKKKPEDEESEDKFDAEAMDEGEDSEYNASDEALRSAFRSLRTALNNGGDEAGAKALRAAIEACS